MEAQRKPRTDGPRHADGPLPKSPSADGWQLEELREELQETRVTQVRAEAQLASKDELIAELKAMLADLRRP